MPSNSAASQPKIDPNDLASDRDYHNQVFDGLSLKRKVLENCTFVGCSFANADLTDARLNASVFRACNLSNARVAGCNCFATTFEQCKIMGVDFREGITFIATTFTQCTLDYAVFRGVSLAKMRFDRCCLVEVDLSLTDLKEASFVDCDLTGADIDEAAFFQTDLRGAKLTGWNLKRHDLNGTIITPSQFAALAFELGIQIREP